MTRRLRIASGLSGILALVVVGLYVFQDRLIYQPPRTSPDELGLVQSAGVTIRSSIVCVGKACPQVSFYVPGFRRHKDPPNRLWVLFHGNGSLATHFMPLARQVQAATDGKTDFLLVEYPGYGLSKGRPSPETLQAASDAAFAALANELHESQEHLLKRTSVYGISLGCAAALQFASRHNVQEAVLAAPFTKLSDIVRRRVGWPLVLLLRSDYDNRARMREVLAQSHPPKITIIHGTRDIIVPHWMGRDLARMSPAVKFVSIAGAGHDDLPVDGTNGVVALMSGR